MHTTARHIYIVYIPLIVRIHSPNAKNKKEVPFCTGGKDILSPPSSPRAMPTSTFVNMKWKWKVAKCSHNYDNELVYSVERYLKLSKCAFQSLWSKIACILNTWQQRRDGGMERAACLGRFQGERLFRHCFMFSVRFQWHGTKWSNALQRFCFAKLCSGRWVLGLGVVLARFCCISIFFSFFCIFFSFVSVRFSLFAQIS